MTGDINGKGRVKLRGRNGTAPEAAQPDPIPLSPLPIKAVVLHKSAAIERLSLGGLPAVDLDVFENGEYLILWLAEPIPEA